MNEDEYSIRERIYDFSHGLFAVNDGGLRAARISSDLDKKWVLESGEVLSDAEMIRAGYRVLDVVETADDAVNALYKLSHEVKDGKVPADVGFAIAKEYGDMEIYPNGVGEEVDESSLEYGEELRLLKALPTWMNADLIEAATETEPDRRRLMLKTEGRGWVDTTPLVFDADELIDPREVNFGEISSPANTVDDSRIREIIEKGRFQAQKNRAERDDFEEEQEKDDATLTDQDETVSEDADDEKVSDPTVTSVLLDEAKIIGLTAQTRVNDFLNSRRAKNDDSVKSSESKDTEARTVAEEVENVAADAKKAFSKFQRDAKKAYRVYKAFREQD